MASASINVQRWCPLISTQLVPKNLKSAGLINWLRVELVRSYPFNSQFCPILSSWQLSVLGNYQFCPILSSWQLSGLSLTEMYLDSSVICQMLDISVWSLAVMES